MTPLSPKPCGWSMCSGRPRAGNAEVEETLWVRGFSTHFTGVGDGGQGDAPAATERAGGAVGSGSQHWMAPRTCGNSGRRGGSCGEPRLPRPHQASPCPAVGQGDTLSLGPRTLELLKGPSLLRRPVQRIHSVGLSEEGFPGSETGFRWGPAQTRGEGFRGSSPCILGALRGRDTEITCI